MRKTCLLFAVCFVLCAIAIAIAVWADYTSTDNENSIIIENIYFTDGQNIWFGIPNLADTYSMHITLTSTANATVYAAFYNEQGKMESVYADKTSLSTSLSLSFDVDITEDIAFYKLFVVNDELSPCIQYPMVYIKDMFLHSMIDFANNTFAFYGDDENFEYVSIPQSAEFLMNGEPIPVQRELFNLGYTIEFISHGERLGQFNKVNIKTPEYAYLTSELMYNPNEDKLILKLIDAAGEHVIQCADKVLFNDYYVGKNHLKNLLSDSNILNSLIRYGRNSEGNIDYIYQAFENEGSFWISFDGQARYDKINKTFSGSNFEYTLSNETLIFFATEEEVTAGGIEDLEHLATYKVTLYNVSGDFNTAEAAVIYTLNSITSYTPTYVIKSIESLGSVNRITAYVIGPDTIDGNDTKEFILDSAIDINVGDVYRFDIGKNGMVRAFQSIFPERSDTRNPFGNLYSGFSGSLGLLYAIDENYVRVDIMQNSFKIYSLGSKPLFFKKDYTGDIIKTAAEQMEVERNTLLVCYDGRLRAVLQLD
jgi:hypothetical protein